MCGCQSAFIALIASNSNSAHTPKNTYRLWTHLGLIGALEPSFKLCRLEKNVAHHCAVPGGHMTNKMAPVTEEPAKRRIFLRKQSHIETGPMLDGTNKHSRVENYSTVTLLDWKLLPIDSCIFQLIMEE